MKKFISLALCAVLILATLTACGTASKTKNTYTIGLCNYVNDASLNQIVENIQSQLAAIGKEKGVTFLPESSWSFHGKALLYSAFRTEKFPLGSVLRNSIRARELTMYDLYLPLVQHPAPDAEI